MDLAEYKGKELFEEIGIPIVKGITVGSIEELEGIEIEYPVVVKAQVLTGGRGKKGGVRFAENYIELKSIVSEMLGSSINEFIVNKVLVVPKIEIEKEFYLSIMLDRNSKSYLMMFSPIGGVDIEETSNIFKLEIDPILGLQTTDVRYLTDKANLSGVLIDSFTNIALKLYWLCVQFNCMLVEINPLVVTPDNNLIALDSKVNVDDDAVYRFPSLLQYRNSLPKLELVEEASLFNFLYIPCEPEGNAVVMSNGSGMLMTCIDGLTAKGIKVSAVLDLGGGAVRSRIKEAVRILLKTKNAEVLFINIFGGITRCDEVAEGIRDAVNEYGIDKPIVVRLEGTNKGEGIEILKGLKRIVHVNNLTEGINAVRAEVCK